MGLGRTAAKGFVMKLSLNSTGSLLILAQFPGLLCATPAVAQDTAALQQQIQQLQANFQRQIQDLRAQLKKVQAEAAQSRGAEARASQHAPVSAQPMQTALTPPTSVQAIQQTPPAKPLPKGAFQLGGITVTLGGFIAVEGVYRSRNETADIGSSFGSGMPLPNTPAYHMGEFRGSARQSRVSLLAQGDVDDVTHLAAYGEVDFLGVGTTSNSTESNSYVPRLRVAYATYDRSDLGLHLLGGQEWSLLTMNKVGIVPRQEDIPLTIDAQYVSGFNWTRNWQVRAVKDFDDHRFWLGASIEGPQASYSGSTTIPGGKTVTATATGGSLLNGTISTYSTDVVPDFIVKAAADPGWGHYELFGLTRFFTDRVSNTIYGSNATVVGGGIGGGMILPVIPRKLDFRLSGLFGNGVGRYGSAQFPDATFSEGGRPKPLTEYSLLAGLEGHPAPSVDIYAYVGTEQAERNFTGGTKLGYGNPASSNAGCDTELSTLTCTANTSGVVQGTIGAWWRFLQGDFGTVQAGAQYSYTKRNIFAGAGATPGTTVSPSTDENMFLISFRYYPFQ
jgi:hypothetical protein